MHQYRRTHWFFFHVIDSSRTPLSFYQSDNVWTINQQSIQQSIQQAWLFATSDQFGEEQCPHVNWPGVWLVENSFARLILEDTRRKEESEPFLFFVNIVFGKHCCCCYWNIWPCKQPSAHVKKSEKATNFLNCIVAVILWFLLFLLKILPDCLSISLQWRSRDFHPSKRFDREDAMTTLFLPRLEQKKLCLCVCVCRHRKPVTTFAI